MVFPPTGSSWRFIHPLSDRDRRTFARRAAGEQTLGSFVLCSLGCDVEPHSAPITSVCAQEQMAGCRCAIARDDALTLIMSPHGDVWVQSAARYTEVTQLLLKRLWE